MTHVPPRHPPRAPKGQAAPSREPAAAADALPVFLLEDDDAVRDAVASALRAAGFEVIAFSSARRFLEHYDGQPGCLVADLDLPGMSGPELLHCLQAAALPLPAIFTNARLWRRGLDAVGRDDRLPLLLQKPYGVDELLPLIRLAISSRSHRAGTQRSEPEAGSCSTGRRLQPARRRLA
jgi:FixJ family two-component response regulator